MASGNYAAKLLQTAAVATGNGVTIDLVGRESLTIQVEGITTATVTFEGSLDGTTWFGVGLVDSTGATVASATANGIFHLPYGRLLKVFRARISAWTSGAVTVRSMAQ